MKQIPLNIQIFSAEDQVSVTYVYQYDLHGHDKAVEVMLKYMKVGGEINGIFLDLEGEKDVTNEWKIFRNGNYCVAQKIFYEKFSQTLYVNTSMSDTKEVQISGGNNFPPESSKHGIRLNDDIQIGNTDVKVSELATLLRELIMKPTIEIEENGWSRIKTKICTIYWLNTSFQSSYGAGSWTANKQVYSFPQKDKIFDPSKMIFLGTARCSDGAISHNVSTTLSTDTKFYISAKNQYSGAVNNAYTYVHALLIVFN